MQQIHPVFYFDRKYDFGRKYDFTLDRKEAR